jgi:hypothetical protein
MRRGCILSEKRGMNRSVNEVICHGIPDQRPLQEGDIVNLGVLYDPPDIMNAQLIYSRYHSLL